jgi:hypothetical protein
MRGWPVEALSVLESCRIATRGALPRLRGRGEQGGIVRNGLVRSTLCRFRFRKCLSFAVNTSLGTRSL